MNCNRTRNWGFLLYPDSMPSTVWQDLDDYHIPYIVSPLHDKDVDENGELKKPHYHAMFLFSGVKTYEQVLPLVRPFGVNKLERVHDSNAYARYFLHLDNPDKFRYSQNDLRFGGGVDIISYLSPTQSQIDTYIVEMQDYVCSSGTLEFCDLMDYSRKNRRDTWFYALTHGSSFIMIHYLQSYRNKIKGVRSDA